MTDGELIDYCELHCTTERALFADTHINRMIELAGYPTNYVRSVTGWHSVHEEMLPLVDLARSRMNELAKDAQ